MGRLYGFQVATKVNLAMIQQTLEAAGVEFIGTPEDGPGIRLRSPDRQI